MTAALTTLEQQRHTTIYQQRLQKGLDHFGTWRAQTNASHPWHAKHAIALDGQLATYVQHCHDTGVNIWLPRHAVLGTQHTLLLRGKLTRAWNSLKSWTMSEPLRHRTPVPLELMKVAFATGLDWILAGGAPALLLPLLVGMRLAFFGLLRPGELCKLVVSDIMVRRANGLPYCAIVALKEPKNRAFLGRAQFAVVRDEGTVRWLVWMMEELRPTDRLWPSSDVQLRSLFADLMQRSGFAHLKLTPGCLRPGGTTWLFMEQNLDVTRLQHAGRWASPTSLHSYIQEAMAHLVWIVLAPSEEARIDHVVLQTAAVWQDPPSVPRLTLSHAPRGWIRAKQSTFPT
jgi:hypothetical protein